MSIEQDSTQERFEEFLRTYKDDHGNLAYWSRIQQISLSDETSLTVDFMDLTSFDNIFSALSKEDPMQFLKIANFALRSILRIEDPDYMAGLDEEQIQTRIINYSDYVPLRSIRSRHIGKLIRISGILMRASEVKPLLIQAIFKCRRCGEELPQMQEDGRYIEPEQCTVCGKKTPVRLIPEKSQFKDWQKVRIQESPDELPPGQMPRSVDVIFEGDIVDLSRPGDLVKVTGILQTSPDFSRRGGRLATFNIFIQANGVEIAEKEYEQIELSDEDEKEIRKLAEDPYVHERIFASIAPSIKGHERIKESIALLLFGGVGKTLPDGTRLRGRSNILIIGDPGTGKSVHGDEEIYIRTPELNNPSWCRQQIRGFVDALMNKYPGQVVSKGDTEILRLSKDAQLFTMSINPDTLKSHKSQIIEVSRHQTKKLVRVSTRSGREILVTPDHSLSTIDNGKLRVLSAQTLRPGAYLPIVRKINLDGSKADSTLNIGDIFPDDEMVQTGEIHEQITLIASNHCDFANAADASNITVGTMKKYVSMPQNIPKNGWVRRKYDNTWFPQEIQLDASMGRIIGFYLSEGNTEKVMVRFTSLDDTIKTVLENDVRNVFGKATIFDQGVYLCQSSVSKWFSYTFGTGAANKVLPERFFVAPIVFRRALLSAYFTGDGWIEEKSASVNVTTKSKVLAFQISDFLSTLGIFSSIHLRKLKSGTYKGRIYYKVTVSGDELFKFHSLVGFVLPSKQKRLDAFVKVLSSRTRYQSRDIIPNFGNLCIEAAKDLGIKNNRGTSSRTFLGELRGKTYRQRVGRKYLQQVISRLEKYNSGSHSAALDKLITLANSDVYWDKVTKIETVDEETTVYDIGTDDGHFIIANGNLLVHNSQILKFVAQLASRSLYTSGKGTTAAGLTAAVMHDPDTGGMTLEAGALVLADQGIACIDEFDKMDPNDRTAIHEAMEQHTVSIAKAGIVATLNARTSILAAANPTLGRYESSLSVQDNIKLPFTILSRFDLLWILVDTIDAKKDRDLAKFILGMHRLKRSEVSKVTPPIAPKFLKKYIGYANRYVIPQLTVEASEVIENFYVDLRKSAEGGAPVPITARQLEALVRLSEARARMALRAKVTKEDAESAVRLMEDSLRMVALDTITGKIDIDRLVAKMSTEKRQSSDVILKTMRDMEAEGSSTVSEEALIERVGKMGLSREKVEEAIKKLLAEGILYSPTSGKLKRS